MKDERVKVSTSEMMITPKTKKSKSSNMSVLFRHMKNIKELAKEVDVVPLRNRK